MGLFDVLNRRKERPKTAEEMSEQRIYDYKTPEGRASTAEWLLQQAKNERTGQEAQWRRYESYYNGDHEVAAELGEVLESQGVGFTPPAIPDPFIMVESQIIPDVPEPEFRGREDDMDSERAKERGLAVKYICEANRLGDMNTANERRLRKYGDAFGRRTGTMKCPAVTVRAIFASRIFLWKISILTPRQARKACRRRSM